MMTITDLRKPATETKRSFADNLGRVIILNKRHYLIVMEASTTSRPYRVLSLNHETGLFSLSNPYAGLDPLDQYFGNNWTAVDDFDLVLK